MRLYVYIYELSRCICKYKMQVLFGVDTNHFETSNGAA